MKISELAKKMGVTERDVDSLMEMIRNAIEQDEALVRMSAEDRAELVAAYVRFEVKKFSDFCATLTANQEKRDAFNLYLLDQLKGLNHETPN